MDIQRICICIFGLIIFWCLSAVQVDTACTWPSFLANSQWRDSRSGLVTFQESEATGWSFTVSVQSGSSPQTRDQWACHMYNETDGYLVMKTTETFIQFVVNVYTAYRCMRMQKITDNSYRYYLVNPKQSTIEDLRLSISDSESESDWSVLFSSQYTASGSEFIVLVQTGYESASKIMCPYLFLADYQLTLTSNNTCDVTTETSTIEMCADNNVIGMSGASCVSSLFYTSAVELWCVDVVTTGSATFVALYNGLQDNATVDDNATFFFSCIAVNADHTELSVVPNYCREGQSSSTVPLDADTGSTLTLTAVSAPCPPCPTLSDPTEGNVTKVTDGAVTTATYTCNDGFTLTGEVTRVCQENGSWSGTGASCTCPFPEAPANGSVSMATDGLSVSYTCNIGSVLVGTSSRTCQTVLNTWTGSEPSCETCQYISNITNGSYVVSSTGLTSLATFTCEAGTTLDGVQTRTCQTDTTWSQTSPSCVSCAGLTSPDSGDVTISTDGASSTATYTCAHGYYLVGSNVSTCSSTGSWDNSPPTCKCESPQTPVNGTMTLSDDAMTSSYTCDVWLTLSGSAQRLCQTDGTGWSGDEPTCVECMNALSPPINGSLNVSSNGTVTLATYSCDVGTTMSGNAMFNCESSGQWSNTEPTCTTCQDLPSLTSGSIALASDDVVTSAKYTCDVGSTINGSSTVTCEADGTWIFSDVTPTCVTCPSLTLTAGDIVLTSDGMTSSATLTCNNGYVSQGASTSVCQSNGTWSVTDTVCVSMATEAASSSSSATDLLPAVVVLALLTVIFAGAFSAALFYIWKQRKRQKLQSQLWSNIDQGFPETSAQTTTSAAPMDHKRHVFDLRKILSSRPPAGHTPVTGDPSSTRSSASSSLSFGSPRLEWAKEATVSSILMTPAEPAPWAKKKTSNVMQRPTPDELKLNLDDIRTPRIQRDNQYSVKAKHDTPRKKAAVSKPRADQNMNTLQSTASLTSGGLTNNPLMPPRSNLVQSRVERQQSDVSRRNTRHNGRRRQGDERATTPVKHVLEVKDPDYRRTPRSSKIVAVQ